MSESIEAEFFEEMLTTGKCREALEWLKEGVGTLGESLTNEDAQAVVARIYEAGASEVIAVDIDIDTDEYENTGMLVIKLDCIAANRRSVLAICNEINARSGYSSVEDLGQTYALVVID